VTANGGKLDLKLLEVRAHRVSCALRVASLDPAQDLFVTVVLARAKRSFDVLSCAIKRVQDIEIEMGNRIEHRRQYGMMRGLSNREVKIKSPFDVLARLGVSALLCRLTKPRDISIGRAFRGTLGKTHFHEKPSFDQLAKKPSWRAMKSERREESLPRLAGEKRADPMPDFDEPHCLQALHCFAQ
jgi:hypothetical protein